MPISSALSSKLCIRKSDSHFYQNCGRGTWKAAKLENLGKIFSEMLFEPVAVKLKSAGNKILLQ